MNRIKRAKTADRFMTIIFYCIAVFFFMFLAAFAGYVIIKGFAGADASMFKFSRRGSIGNQLFNTISYNSSYWYVCRNLSCKICQGWNNNKIYKNMY